VAEAAPGNRWLPRDPSGGLAFLPLALPILSLDRLDRLIPRVTLGLV
jgi:hypothetical protein